MWHARSDQAVEKFNQSFMSDQALRFSEIFLPIFAVIPDLSALRLTYAKFGLTAWV